MDLGHVLCDAKIFWHMLDDIIKNALMEAGFPLFLHMHHSSTSPGLFMVTSKILHRVANLLNEVP